MLLNIPKSISTEEEHNNSAVELDDLIKEKYNILPKSLQEEINQIENPTNTQNVIDKNDVQVVMIQETLIDTDQIPMPNEIHSSKPEANKN